MPKGLTRSKLDRKEGVSDVDSIIVAQLKQALRDGNLIRTSW